MTRAIHLLRRLTRSLAKVRGGRVLVEPLRRTMGHVERTVSIDDFDDDLLLELRLHEHMESHIFWRGSYSRDVLCVINALLRRGGVFIDVGANIGEVSLFAAKRIGLQGRVLAVEPSPEVVGRLRHHIEQNRLNQIQVIDAALGRRPGTLELYRGDRGHDALRHSGLTTAYRTVERSVPIGVVPV